MATAISNSCLICRTSVYFGQDTELINSRKKICHRFINFVSRYVNLETLSSLDSNTDWISDINCEESVCCFSCLNSVQEFCDTYETFESVQLDLLRITESISRMFSATTASNYKFGKEFISTVNTNRSRLSYLNPKMVKHFKGHSRHQGRFQPTSRQPRNGNFTGTQPVHPLVQQSAASPSTPQSAISSVALISDNISKSSVITDDPDLQLGPPPPEEGTDSTYETIQQQHCEAAMPSEDYLKRIGYSRRLIICPYCRNACKLNNRFRHLKTHCKDVTPEQLCFEETKKGSMEHWPKASLADYENFYKDEISRGYFNQGKTSKLSTRSQSGRKIQGIKFHKKKCANSASRGELDDDDDMENEIGAGAMTCSSSLNGHDIGEFQMDASLSKVDDKSVKQEILDDNLQFDLDDHPDPGSPIFNYGEDDAGDSINAHHNQSNEDVEMSVDVDVTTRVKIITETGDNLHSDDSDDDAPHIRNDFLQQQDMTHEANTESDNKTNVFSKINRPIHKCLMCNKICRDRFNLDEHLRFHINEKPLYCKLCPKEFSVRKNLIIHKRIHHPDGKKSSKGFECDICGKVVTDLWKHFRYVHKTDNELICDVCGKGFVKQCEMNFHLETVHITERNFQCDICLKWYKHPKCVRKHKRQVHKVK